MNNSSSVRGKSNWTLLKIFIKSNNRKFLFLVINTIFIYIFLTSFFMIWFSNQNSMLQNYLTENHDWNRDMNLSTYYSTISSNYVPDYDGDHLEKVTADLEINLNSLIPSVAINSTSLFSLEFYHFPNLSALLRYQVNGFLPTLNSILHDNLIEGRLPNNSTELLYYKESSSSSTYQLNDTISLQGLSSQFAFKMNFTIVGILNNLENAFLLNGLSVDILDWTMNIKSYRYSYTPLEKFFTTSLFLAEIANSYPSLSTGRAVIVDFDYMNEAIKGSKISRYLSQYQKTLTSLEQLVSDPQETYTVGLDLYDALTTFRNNWIQKTIIVLSLTFPLIILLSFLCYESFNYNQKEYLASLGLLQTLGLCKKKLSRIVIIEVVDIFFFSLIVGNLFSVVIGLPLSYLLGTSSFQEYFSFITTPLFLFVILTYSIIYLILGLVIELRKVRRIPFAYHERSWLQKFFSIPEIMLSIPGVTATSMGIFVLRFTSEAPLSYAFLHDIAWGLVFFGAVMITLVVFFLISRLIVLLFSWLSKQSWSKKKNLFTFSLKNIKFNNSYYKTIISFILVIGIGLIPGIILKPSITNHLAIENTLSTGGADLAIISRSSNLLPSQIEVLNISGVEKTTLLTTSTLTLERDTFFGEKQYTVPILCVHNQTELLETIDLSTLEYGFTTDDILSLEQNLSFLMCRDYAVKNGYNDGLEFTNELFGDVTESISLNFINSFNFFPLLPQPNRNPLISSTVQFSLVMNLETSSALEDSLVLPSITKTYSMLIKTNSSEIITSIKQQINQISPNVEVLDINSITNQNDLESINFTIIFLVFSSIVSFLIIILYSYITITNILKIRTKAIEIEYTIGISKKQILRGFILEISIVAIVPLVICSICGIFFGKLIGIFLTSNNQTYSSFSLKFTGLFVLAIIMVVSSLTIGWLSGIIPRINKYKLVKEV
ncbi:MAG: ABC transporter permease [Candidatus Heimdallarchaeota archaeon]